MPKMHWHWFMFGFQLPKDLVLELTGKYFSCSERSSWKALCNWPSLNFSGQILMHRLRTTIIFPKMLHLKCQFKNLVDIYIILLFTPLYILFI